MGLFLTSVFCSVSLFAYPLVVNLLSWLLKHFELVLVIQFLGNQLVQLIHHNYRDTCHPSILSFIHFLDYSVNTYWMPDLWQILWLVLGNSARLSKCNSCLKELPSWGRHLQKQINYVLKAITQSNNYSLSTYYQLGNVETELMSNFSFANTSVSFSSYIHVIHLVSFLSYTFTVN